MSRGVGSLPVMQGLDVDDALRRLLGREDLLRQVMRAFAASSTGAGQRLRQHFGQQEHAAAQALAHQIKGSAANISALTLSALAARIEANLKAGDSSTPHALLDQFELALTVVLTDIAGLDSPADVGDAAASDCDEAQMLACVRAIEQHVRTDLGRVQQELANLTRLTRGSTHQVWTDDLNQCFEQFRLLDLAQQVRQFLAQHTH